MTAPERIWAFSADDIAENEGGATIVAHESYQPYATEYVRADLAADHTAALDKLIAEAEARGKTIGEATEKIRRLIEWLGEDDCNVFLLPHDDVVKMRAALAASKKGGV